MDGDREGEFCRQAATIAMTYAEWHKVAPCSSAIEKSLADAYLKGCEDAALITNIMTKQCGSLSG
jgi:hypothetical protein